MHQNLLLAIKQMKKKSTTCDSFTMTGNARSMEQQTLLPDNKL